MVIAEVWSEKEVKFVMNCYTNFLCWSLVTRVCTGCINPIFIAIFFCCNLVQRSFQVWIFCSHIPLIRSNYAFAAFQVVFPLNAKLYSVLFSVIWLLSSSTFWFFRKAVEQAAKAFNEVIDVIKKSDATIKKRQKSLEAARYAVEFLDYKKSVRCTPR